MSEAKSLTQHQKRVIIIEIFYQYFLDPYNQTNFNDILSLEMKALPKQLGEQIKDMIWYQDELISKIQNNLKATWNFRSLKPIEKAILFLAAYEIVHTTTKKAIIINEAVILAKQYCDNNAYKYINGVLDKINSK